MGGFSEGNKVPRLLLFVFSLFCVHFNASVMAQNLKVYDLGPYPYYTEIKPKAGSGASKSDTAKIFAKTLSDHEVQDRLKKYYKLDNKQYEELAGLSVGILAAESENGESKKYKLKERYPWAVPTLKKFRDSEIDLSDRWRSKYRKLDWIYEKGDILHDYRYADKKAKKELHKGLAVGGLYESIAKIAGRDNVEEILPILFDMKMNSRGPTQIKYFPEKLQKEFPEIEKANLSNASNAAIATMGYLVEALPQLRALAQENGFEIPPGREIDHLIYMYKGPRREIIKGTATVDDNIYFKQVRAGRSEYNIETAMVPPADAYMDERELARSNSKNLEQHSANE